MESVGYFTVESGKLRITDPCYDDGTRCMGDVEDAADGLWEGFVIMRQSGFGGLRAGELLAFNIEEIRRPSAEGLAWARMPFEVGVDSGQAGIFDWGSFPHGKRGEDGHHNKDAFYDRCCQTTLGEDIHPRVQARRTQKGVCLHNRRPAAGPVDGMGVVSESGDGDGRYRCFVARKNGKVIAVKIPFLGDEDYDEDADSEAAERA